VLLAVREAVVGACAGYAVSLLTSALVTAGEIVSNEMGFSIAQVMDPLTGKSTPVASSLFEVMGYLLLFGTSLHHEVLRVLGASYEMVPVGKGFDFGVVHERLCVLVAAATEYGLHYAVPILAVMSLLTAALVILARAVPNLNLMEFSWGLRILLALVAASWFLSEGRPFLLDMFADLLQRAQLLFRDA
jgi:flagellar biosynthetic protein FliR